MTSSIDKKHTSKTHSIFIWGGAILLVSFLVYSGRDYIQNFLLSTKSANESHLRSGLNDTGRILFTRDGLLYLMSSDGSNINELNASSNISEFIWSPSGDKIIFVDHLSLYIMNADGSNLQELDNVADVDETDPDKNRILHPVWSPDGKKIAYEKEYLRSGKHFRDIKVSDADGSDRYNLDAYLFDYFGDGYPDYCGFADWAPDGVYVLFSC